MNKKEFVNMIEVGIENLKCCGNCADKLCPSSNGSGFCVNWKLDCYSQEARIQLIIRSKE